MEPIEIIIPAEYEGMRLDVALPHLLPEVSRSKIQKDTEKGAIFCNGKPVVKKHIVSAGDVISYSFQPLEELMARPQNIPIDIVYEDDDLLVVNKQKGMVVHPAPGNYEGTLVNALLYHCKDSLSGINGVMRPGIVHRIDKDTSGLLIVAKNDFSHTFLAEQIKEHSFTREYEAVVVGNIKDENGTIDAPIGRNPNDRKKMCITSKNSKNAVTHYSVICRYNGYTHIKCVLETGRTHQIRVHMASLGHPVSGDTVYGIKNEKVDFTGQCLHARKIGFVHPKTGNYLEFTSDLPEYFQHFLYKLENISK